MVDNCIYLWRRPFSDIELVSCNLNSRHKIAPKERYNLAHGVSRGFRGTLPLPFPSPARAGEGCRRQGEERSNPGLTPWAKIFRPLGAFERQALASSDFINELTLQDTRLGLRHIKIEFATDPG